MKTKNKLRPGLFILVTSFMGMFQYQNCAQPVNQSSQSGDPAYLASPIAGSNNNAIVSSNNGKSQMLFEVSSVVLTPESNVLRPGGICSLPADQSQVQWQLSENTENSLIVMQGSEKCDHGSFYVNLSAQIAHFECEKSYSLSASLPGESSAQMNIIKHCSGVASN